MPRRATVDLSLTQGDDFEVEITFQDDDGAPVNVSTHTYAAQTRVRPDAAAYTAFTVDATSASVGIIKLTMAASLTATLKSGVWDLEDTVAGKKQTILGGKLTVLQGVTR